MNVQAHMSGQIPGQLSNQAGPQLPGVPQNVGTIPSQMQNLGSMQGSWRVDPDIDSIRNCVAQQISNVFRRNSQANEQKLSEMTKKLETLLFKTAASKEEYMDTLTLQNRITIILHRMSAGGNRNQQLVHPNPSSVGTMIPTPGMEHSSSTNFVVSTMDGAAASGTKGMMMVPNPAAVGGLLPTVNGSIGGMQRNLVNSSNGLLSNGYQQLVSSISVGSGGNLSSLATSRHSTSSQMIPTPGLNDSRSLPMNTQTGGVFSSDDSVMTSQHPQSRQYISSQHGRMMHNVGGMSMGTGSTMQPKPAGYGLGMLGNEVQLMNGTAQSEGHISPSVYLNSQKPLQQHFNPQIQQQLMPNGEGFTNNVGDVSGSGDIFGYSAHNQSVNPLGLQSNSRANSMFQSHLSNLHALQQVSGIKSQSIDQSMSMLSTSHSKEHLFQLQEQQQQQAQQQQYSQYPYQSLVQFTSQHQQRLPNQQHQELLKDATFRRSQFTSHAQLASTAAGHILPDHEVKSRNENMQNQILDQYQFSDLQNAYRSNLPIQDYSKGTHVACLSSSSQELQSPLMQTSHQFQQIVQPQKQVAQTQNNFNSLSVVQSENPVTEEWCIAAEVKPTILSQSAAEQIMQEDFRQRLKQQDEAQRPHLGMQGCLNGKAILPGTSPGGQCSSGAICRSGGQILRSRKKEIIDQQRWLLFLRHAKSCSASGGKCVNEHCVVAQNLCRHMDKCQEIHCKYTYCCTTKRLLGHFNHCHSGTCALCAPVRRWISQHKISAGAVLDCTQVISINGVWKLNPAMELPKVAPKSVGHTFETSEGSSIKRVKLEHPFPSVVQPKGEPVPSLSLEEPDKPMEISQQPAPTTLKSDVMNVKLEQAVKYPFANISKVSENNCCKVDDNTAIMKSDVQPEISKPSISALEPEPLWKEVESVKQETKQETRGSTVDHVAVAKSGKTMIKGVSMIEFFTPEQVREHITSLRQWVGQSKAKAERNQAMEHSMSENSCQLCAVEKLTFEPPPIYCSLCGGRIKRNAMYYTTGSGDTRHYFCIPCYNNESRSDTIEVDGIGLLKAKMDKKKNDEETEEWWVQCDKCEAWQHQICALFNGRRNDGGQAEYTCPNCYIAEVERGEREPLPQSAVLGAKDLPRTILSDHIEQRLFRRLKHERQERARVQSKSFDEVPGAEGLVVRVVSSVDKKLEVKQRFLEIFQEDNYPTEYPYKSKAVLLFQKIEGVEVCLFGMYVQEFGSECQLPNQRRVYLSYLDSVKYFRPEIKAVTGEALRTFVYHEILIGYLEYCKKRGFTSCYIWACPPLKGEDYILYCHPEIQKTPKSDKLREWYLSMLRKARGGNIVVDLTNLYDHFFVSIGECKAKVTAARLPYFDGDYWPGAAEDIISQLRQEEDGRKQQKKGKTKKTITKRALKAAAQTDLSSNASKDALLMQKLGETINPMKEDFIMVHLQYPCSHCCYLIVSGRRWTCSRQCKNFQLCDRCYEVEHNREERDRHPVNSREKHILNPIEVNDIPTDTKDKDEILESEFFDTRQAFLSLCQGNHYQYDTLRRGKHSSMMVLYHLHNPTAPAFVTTCNTCHQDIETGQGWRCETCPDYDVCNACYQDGSVDHPHKLTSPPSTADRDAQNKEARQKRVLQLRKMLDLLVHASQCRSAQCLYPNCRKVKGLFRHGALCKVRASGGCQLCKRMWHLLQLHARACRESECHVPRCKDLKEHLRRSQQQSESRRRAAVIEMMRQRAAEVAGSDG